MSTRRSPSWFDPFQRSERSSEASRRPPTAVTSHPVNWQSEEIRHIGDRPSALHRPLSLTFNYLPLPINPNYMSLFLFFFTFLFHCPIPFIPLPLRPSPSATSGGGRSKRSARWDNSIRKYKFRPRPPTHICVRFGEIFPFLGVVR